MNSPNIIFRLTESKLKTLGDNFDSLSTHYKEQVFYRSIICEDCFESGFCRECHCGLPRKWYTHFSCNNGHRFPDLMDNDNWTEFKKNKGMEFFL